MTLTDHLHRKDDPIRAFLDERLTDFRPAREKWHAAHQGNQVCGDSNAWSVLGWALDYRVRMMLAAVSIEKSLIWNDRRRRTALGFVARELHQLQEMHGDVLGVLPEDDELHLLKICYVLALYESFARMPFSRERSSPLYSLKDGAQWRAHANRVPPGDVLVLLDLARPCLELFPNFRDQRITLGPVFSDSALVDGADGDLIINTNLIEIKCIPPGFDAKAVRQVIAYALLDADDAFGLERCSLYFARYASWASWDLNDLVLAVSDCRYNFHSLRTEFHEWLVARDDLLRRQHAFPKEVEARFPHEWNALQDARREQREVALFDNDGRVRTAQAASAALEALTKRVFEAGMRYPSE